MSLFNFCASPRTMQEIVDEGYTRDMVYNSVKNGVLVNLNRKDLWGRVQHGKGLFQVVELAKQVGVVVTIETVPSKPLAMGNHEMRVDVRPAREIYRGGK